MALIADLPNRGLRISVMFNDVTITIGADSAYEAQVLFEDIVDRLKKGETISLEASAYKEGQT